MRTCRSRSRRAAEWALGLPGVIRLAEMLDHLTPPGEHTVTVLMFHRVDELATCREHAEPDLISAEPAVFQQEMELLVERFQPVEPPDVLAALDGGPLPRRAVLVTFDDGFRDFQTHAWPVLRRLGIPAVLFVPTGFAEQPERLFWWDTLHQVLDGTAAQEAWLPGLGRLDLSSPAARRCATFRARMHLTVLPGRAAEEAVDGLVDVLGYTPRPFNGVLGWPELLELQKQGVVVAPHGRWHRPLAGLPAHELAEEVSGSQTDIAAHLGACPPLFSYPYGAFDNAAVEAVEKTGFEAAFSTRSGHAHLDGDSRFTLRRVNVDHGTLAHFRLDLTHSFGRYTELRQRSAQRR